MINAKESDKLILVLCDDFRGHSTAGCKEFSTRHHERRKMLKWATMKFGLTPAVQTLSNVVNKLFKSFLCEVYDLWSLNYPINPTSGAPLQPTSSSSELGRSGVG